MEKYASGMTLTQTIDSATPAGDDLGQATVRELIVQLALIEDEHRSTLNPCSIATLSRREQAIVAALRREGPALIGRGKPNPAGLESIHVADGDVLVEK
ncbi:hypothetical protein [Specibacter sp. RAF43]|uniref:hypothetical protein n=1 Tax=Specibacter sp. RAF43 TaxID=3233057 RepID=UPI003F9732F9